MVKNNYSVICRIVGDSVEGNVIWYISSWFVDVVDGGVGCCRIISVI